MAEDRPTAIIVASIGAAAIIVAAIIGVAAKSGNDNQSASTTTGASSSATSVPISNEPQSSMTSAQAAAPQPIRTGKLSLTNGWGAALVTEAPNWNINEGCDAKCEIWFSYDSISSPGNFFAVLPSGQSADYATCSTTTAFESSIPQNQLKQGVQICEQTHGGHFAALTIVGRKLAPNGDIARLDFNVTVW